MTTGNLTRVLCLYRAALARELSTKDKRQRYGNVLLLALQERGVKSLRLGEVVVRRTPWNYPLSPTQRRKHRKLGAVGVVERIEVRKAAE